MSFPTSPANNQTAIVNGITYVFNSTNTTWTRVPVSGGGGGGNVTNIYTKVTSNTNLNTSTTSLMFDTSNGPIYASLPPASSTTNGFSMTFADGGGDKQVNPVYFYTTDGSTINNVVDTFSFNSPNTIFTMIYTSIGNWKVQVYA